MKILNAKVRTGLSTYRPHSLELLVDTIHREDKRYDVVEHPDGTASYLSVTDGIVSYFWHNPKNETGYGGSVFELNMIDGSTRSIRGPWSSNNDWIRQVFGLDSVHVAYVDKPESYERGYTFYAGDITVEKAQEAIKLAGEEWELINASSSAKTSADASGEQAAIIDGSLSGWYVVRENCPTAYKTEKYLWGREPNQRWATRGTDIPDPDMCLNSWHKIQR